MRRRRKVNKQLNIWPGGYKKQKHNRGNPVTKEVKLWRIKTFKDIRESGGTYKDVCIKWGISPNSSGTVSWKIWDYGSDGIMSEEEFKKIKYL
tara:strand:+ start:253 stop:531 length:279 start_codon:yes stop_codon:yes gene_type:complete